MNINRSAAEVNSAAHEQDDAWATMCKYFSMDFKRVLFCDAKAGSC